MSKISRPFPWSLALAWILLATGMLLYSKSHYIAGGLIFLSNIFYTMWLVRKGIISNIKSILSEQLFLAIKMAMNLGLKLTDTSQNLGQKAEPPILAEFLVGLCAKHCYRNGLLQSLEADFERNLAAGATVRRARGKYWAAALNSIGPQLLAAAKRVGIIGIIADYARRLLH